MPLRCKVAVRYSIRISLDSTPVSCERAALRLSCPALNIVDFPAEVVYDSRGRKELRSQ